jgi:hypothetical protein
MLAFEQCETKQKIHTEFKIYLQNKKQHENELQSFSSLSLVGDGQLQWPNRKREDISQFFNRD